MAKKQTLEKNKTQENKTTTFSAIIGWLIF